MTFNKQYITSDLHFGHKNIMKYCPKYRNFNSVDEMNDALIKIWNSTVGPDDEIYHLGDFGFMGNQKLAEILDRLNGKIYFVLGNHDPKKNTSRKLLEDRGEWVKDYHEFCLKTSSESVKINMFHYPILEWNSKFRDAIHFHGHCHGNRGQSIQKNSLDVGFDAHGKILTLSEAINLARTLSRTVL